MNMSDAPLHTQNMSTLPAEKPPVLEEESDQEDEVAKYPPDVGWWPIVQAIGGFFLMFNNWGIVMSYGAFQTYYTEGGISDAREPSTIAWIGSIQTFLLLFGGAIGGKFFDAGYLRPMIITGSLLIVFGTMMVSLSHKYYQFMLSQGVCTGLGMAMTLIPAVGIPGTWFTKRRGFAIGCVLTASSIGGIVYPILLHRLRPQVGFPWAVRIMGFVSLATSAVSIAVLRQRLPARRRGGVIEHRALREPVFALYVVGIFVSFLGFFTFYDFAEAWLRQSGINTHGVDAFYVLPIINAASVAGRLGPNFSADYIGPLNIQAPAMLGAGILVLAWMAVRSSFAALLVVAALYGACSGAAVGLPPVVVATLTTDMRRFGARMGLVFMAMGLGSLIGSPVTGALVQSQGGGYNGARIWAGVTMVSGSLLIAAARLIKTGARVVVKA